ncbi:hypothetical protein DFH08DRAFT_837130 [Mycena albidolilacea]|uniref:Uncharacterized protein n=1 Tax=Mycena albidolilacea TaxID=1033008 RepID=A0AAD7ASU2_9AGAR|nr:hypothetical protein DFH08DRAFT_837130 [Mycena albidolilacea]
MRFTTTLASLALFVGATVHAQTGTTPVICTTGSCWTSPDNATDHGCTNQWAGGVDAWATCGFEGAIICNACLACSTNATAARPGCYTSPTQAEGTGCVSWAGGVDAWNTCGFEGAITCNICGA